MHQAMTHFSRCFFVFLKLFSLVFFKVHIARNREASLGVTNQLFIVLNMECVCVCVCVWGGCECVVCVGVGVGAFA